MDNIEEILGQFMALVRSVSFPAGKYQIEIGFGDEIKPIADNSNKVFYTEKTNGVYVYEIAREYGMGTLASFIKKTIICNLEFKAKQKLYIQKQQELQQLFLQHDLNELATLQFVIGKVDIVTPNNQNVLSNELKNKELSSDDVQQEKPRAHKTSGKKDIFKAPSSPVEQEVQVPDNIAEQIRQAERNMPKKEEFPLPERNPDGSVVGGNILNLPPVTCEDRINVPTSATTEDRVNAPTSATTEYIFAQQAKLSNTTEKEPDHTIDENGFVSGKVDIKV